MAGIDDRVTVGNTATLVDIEGTGTFCAVLVNQSSQSMFFGFANTVTTANGTELKPGYSLEVNLGPADRGLYAITASGGARLDRLGVAA